jgi:hypothetical protein
MDFVNLQIISFETVEATTPKKTKEKASNTSSDYVMPTRFFPMHVKEAIGEHHGHIVSVEGATKGGSTRAKTDEVDTNPSVGQAKDGSEQDMGNLKKEIVKDISSLKKIGVNKNLIEHSNKRRERIRKLEEERKAKIIKLNNKIGKLNEEMEMNMDKYNKTIRKL